MLVATYNAASVNSEDSPNIHHHENIDSDTDYWDDKSVLLNIYVMMCVI